MAKNFQDAVLDHLTDTYVDSQGNEFQGQALSYLLKVLREDGWKNLGASWGFESYLQRKGFVIVEAKNLRGQVAQVVTL